MARFYVNYENNKGKYDSLTIESESDDLVNVINSLIPEIRSKNIVEILEIFEDEEDSENFLKDFE